MPQEPALTTGPAARYLSVTENTLRAWVKAGKVPHSVTPSGQLRFTLEDLNSMIRRVEPKDAA